MSSTIIAVANQKGGVGKTTTSVNLSATLAKAGHKTLLVDLDPQANATSGVGIEKKEGKSVYPVLLGEGKLEDFVIETQWENLSLIPGELDMCGADIEIPKLGGDHLIHLKNALMPLAEKAEYDFIIIDCPPSLSILTLNAFVSARWLVIPLQCEYFALEGISMIMRVHAQIKDSGLNPDLELLGVLMTMFDGRTRLAQQVVSEVQEYLGEKVFETMIPRAIRLAEAPSFGKPIQYYDPHSAGASAYSLLADEILVRLSSRK